MGKSSLGNRIRKARKHAGLSVIALAGEIGRTAFTVYRYEWDRLKPPAPVIWAIAARCGVSVPWLELDVGSMLPRIARRA